MRTPDGGEAPHDNVGQTGLMPTDRLVDGLCVLEFNANPVNDRMALRPEEAKAVQDEIARLRTENADLCEQVRVSRADVETLSRAAAGYLRERNTAQAAVVAADALREAVARAPGYEASPALVNALIDAVRAYDQARGMLRGES